MNDKCPLKAKKWFSYAKSNLCDLNRVRFSMKGEVITQRPHLNG